MRSSKLYKIESYIADSLTNRIESFKSGLHSTRIDIYRVPDLVNIIAKFICLEHFKVEKRREKDKQLFGVLVELEKEKMNLGSQN